MPLVSFSFSDGGWFCFLKRVVYLKNAFVVQHQGVYCMTKWTNFPVMPIVAGDQSCKIIDSTDYFRWIEFFVVERVH